jgi:hypothetical protein
MAIDPKSFESDSLIDYIEKALEAMKDDLDEKDWGIVGSIREMAGYCDQTKGRMRALELDPEVDPKDRLRAMELHNKAIYTIPQIISGLDKLGGSIAARKALGQKPAPTRTGLAAVRELRANGTEGSQKPSTGRTKRTPGK